MDNSEKSVREYRTVFQTQSVGYSFLEAHTGAPIGP